MFNKNPERFSEPSTSKATQPLSESPCTTQNLSINTSIVQCQNIIITPTFDSPIFRPLLNTPALNASSPETSLTVPTSTSEITEPEDDVKEPKVLEPEDDVDEPEVLELEDDVDEPEDPVEECRRYKDVRTYPLHLIQGQ